jgi:hypothetical protein
MLADGERQAYSKLTLAYRSSPFSFSSYVGNVKVVYPCNSLKVAKEKVKELKLINRIGRYKHEGAGIIKWSHGWFEENRTVQTRKQYGKIRIRKGLPSHLPHQIQELLLYGLLHDFFHTGIHRSKIYRELQLNDQGLVELLRMSHSDSSHPLVTTIKKYDRIASYFTRKYKAPRIMRYNYRLPEESQVIDFENLVNQITQVVNKKNVFKLYEFIYKSEELGLLNEAFEFSYTSLKFHLLLIANMIVRDYLHGYLDPFLGSYQPQFVGRLV